MTFVWPTAGRGLFCRGCGWGMGGEGGLMSNGSWWATLALLQTQGRVVLCKQATFCNIYDILSLLSHYMRAAMATREHWQQIDLRCCTFDWYLDRQWSFSALQWWLHREALGGGKCRRNVTPGKSARRKALSDEHGVSGSFLPPLCPRKNDLSDSGLLPPIRWSAGVNCVDMAKWKLAKDSLVELHVGGNHPEDRLISFCWSPATTASGSDCFHLDPSCVSKTKCGLWRHPT